MAGADTAALKTRYGLSKYSSIYLHEFLIPTIGNINFEELNPDEVTAKY